MSGHGDEITRFNVSGKTFFFNKVTAKNGREFLGVNAIWGSGNQERLVIFPEQMVPFHVAWMESMKEITGLSTGDEPIKEVVNECPNCGTGPSSWYIKRGTDAGTDFDNLNEWAAKCRECGITILRGGQGVGQ